MPSSGPLALDHIIILLPAKNVDSLPESFTQAFTITPGGTHADGKTYNKLVILESGVYLEFIAFVDDDPAKKQGHWWGKKTAGSIIDWALTSNDVKDVERLGEFYDEPRKGGRQRLDGKTVEWFVTFPEKGTERGSVPFFCHDATPRELRVPKEGVSHSCGAVGVHNVVIVVAKEKISELVSTYESIFGSPLEKSGRIWRLAEPLTGEDGVNKASSRTVVELRETEGEEDEALVRRNGGVAGVKEISLLCKSESAQKHGVEVIEELFGEARIRIRLNYVDI